MVARVTLTFSGGYPSIRMPASSVGLSTRKKSECSVEYMRAINSSMPVILHAIAMICIAGVYDSDFEDEVNC